MIISNAKIVLEDQIIDGYIEFDSKKIIAIKKGKTTKQSFNAKGLYLLPAFIDSHTHGGYGLDFNMLVNHKHDQELKQYLNKIHHEGVGSVLMTTVTCSDQDLNGLANNYQFIKTIDTDNVIKG
jgi:N-acetylglucosamine-6-phosphate deacetylase